MSDFKINSNRLCEAFAEQVNAMLKSDHPVGTIVLPVQYPDYVKITLLGGNRSPHGGYIHQHVVTGLAEYADGLPRAVWQAGRGHDVGYQTKQIMDQLGYGNGRMLTLRAAPMPDGLRAPEAIAPTEAFPLPMYRSRSVIRPEGFTFSYSR